MIDLDALSQLERIAASVSPVPWEWASRQHIRDGFAELVACVDGLDAPDGNLIIEMRNAAPSLIAELKKAREVIKAAREYQLGIYDVSLMRVWDALAAYDAVTGEKT